MGTRVGVAPDEDPQDVGMAREIARSGAIADAIDDHLRHRAEAFGEAGHEQRPGRRCQLDRRAA